MNTTPEKLHDAMHRIPGMPEHAAARPNATRTAHGKRLQHSHQNGGTSATRHSTPPRVLVAWQNWIAARLGAR